MIKNFSLFTLSGRFQAFGIIFGFLALALIFPLGSIVSGAVLVSVTLHAGIRNALQLVLMTALALAVACFFMLGNPMIGLYAALAQLTPSLLLASVFRATQSLAITLQASALMGVVSFILIDVLFPDNVLFWQQVLTQMFEPILQSSAIPRDEGLANIQTISQYMTGIMIMSMVLVHSSLIFIGHWLYCVAEDSQQYKEDFKNLRLGKVLALLSLGLITAAIVLQSSYLAQLSGIVTILFCIQGMNVIHTLCAGMTNNKLWLIMSYLIVIFVPQAILIIVILGLAETFFALRDKIN
jgi:hypothetical protein